MKKRILISICALLILGLLLGFLQLLVRPKYLDNPEGALIGEYYDQAGGHDVIFVGDCEVYESFVPAVLWQEYGITSYIRGSAQQLVWQSYYLLEETLRYEKPKAVVFNVLALKYGTPQKESFNRMTLDGMKWSSSKSEAIRASMTEEEHFLDYVFPLLRFHSRITELTGDDFRYMFQSPKVSDSGYLMQVKVAPRPQSIEKGRVLSNYTLPATSMDYLEQMRVLCEENGIELILIKAPTNSWAYWWYDQWDEQVRAYAQEKELAYYNFIPEDEAIGIDWSRDTYDEGVHLNVYGAEKMSSYFGKILSENHGLNNLEHDDVTVKKWNENLTQYVDRKQRMEQEEANS